MSKSVQIITLIILFLGCFASPGRASFTTKLEQQINIIDQEAIIPATSISPTDNSLGLIRWDSRKYHDATVYFEAVVKCVNCTGGNTEAEVGLYTEAGDLVTDSTVTTTDNFYTIKKSPDLTNNLTDDTKYSVRARVDADSGAAYIKAARLIVVQNGTNITKTETQVEIGNNTSTTQSSLNVIAGPKIFRYDQEVYSGVQNIYVDATIKVSDAAATTTLALSLAADCSTTVTNSQISVTGTTAWSHIRSSNISSNLTDNTDYWVCLSVSDTYTGYIANAKLVIDQEDANGIHKMQLMHSIINSTLLDNDDSYTNQDVPIEFIPGNFAADNIRYFFEIDLTTNSGIGYGRLFNISDGSSIADSERETGAAGYTRLISDDLSGKLPTEIKNLDTQLRNSATGVTEASASWLVIQFERTSDPQVTFTIEGVEADSLNNGITTSVATDYNSLPFGHLTFNTPRYAAHKLTVTTNAASGYDVSMKLNAYVQGLYPANNIDPFTASWTSPATWSTPDGTAPNDNTGWFGANTSDTRVTGWGEGTGKFGAVTNSAQRVMTSAGPDAGTTAYVTYAMEVNILQPADEYIGSLSYILLPTY